MVKGRKKNAVEIFGVEGFPEKYPEIVEFHNLKQRHCLVNKDVKTRTFVNQYVHDHSLDPGPKYDTTPTMGVKSIKYNNCETFKIKKTKIPTYMDKILNKARESPGVGKYNIAIKSRIEGSSKMTEKAGSL